MAKVVIVSNELPPYRIPLFERLASVPDIGFQAIFCTMREPNRNWEIPPLRFDHVFLKENIVEKNGRYIHNNVQVISALKRFGPDAVITCGFNPTHLYAFVYAMAKGLPHICMTDGTLQSEKGLSRLHRIVRRLVYARTRAFIYASDGGHKLYESYGVDPERCFKSCLCVDNASFASPLGAQAEKRFDFVFCGRIAPVKNPMFALRVAIETAQKLNRKTSILFIGTGEEKDSVSAEAARNADDVNVAFQGFRLHAELPALYQSGRLFLLPTLWDPWGVVVNEACAAGLPAIVSPHCGAAHELVRDGENGFVCDIDAGLWAQRAALLLSNPDLYADFSRRSLSMVGDYNYDRAASGIVRACRMSLRSGRSGVSSSASPAPRQPRGEAE